MRRRALLFTVVAIVAALTVPSAAFGLVNEYGMFFTGDKTDITGCLACHDGRYGQTVHGRFAKLGLVPSAPAGWTTFKAAGDVPVVGAPNPFSGLPWFSKNGSYSIPNLQWITLGDYQGGAATEYIFFSGNTSPTQKLNPWNLVEGLIAEPGHGYEVGTEAPATGLYDVVYGCQRCHMLGTTYETTTPDTNRVPNPAVGIPASATTARQWARPADKTAADFNSDPLVAVPGMSIQCENCHGTGFKSTVTTTKHWNSGTQLSHRISAGTVGPLGDPIPATDVTDLLDSRVCGQCHGSYTTVAGTLGIYGYTPNLPLWKFGDINGLTGGISYTYTPTEAEFLAQPTKYQLFPNGSNARGNHFYYNEWSTSGHAYRGALGTSMGADPDVLKGGTVGHYNPKTSNITCSYCHTGEGYLWSKRAAIMQDFTPTQANTGYMGQECVVCHNPHPSGVGAEDVIREPDPAGVRSNAGRTTANASLCEDCHNWQREVQGFGTTFPPTTTGRGPSHPQRELLHGRSVMFEVADMGEFMPGAKCEECHMPKTNRNENRYSHGMHIMEPGDAKVWQAAAGYTKGQDSCSPCHPGLSRDELQEYIDEWQADAVAAGDAANAAITAAKLRAEFSAASGIELVGRAFVNYRAYLNDASSGMHNPPYIMAGLTAAKEMADSVGGSFDALYATSQLRIGGIGGIVAHVDLGTGASAAGAKVGLEKWDGASWVSEGSTVADVNGNVSFLISPALGTWKYRLRWDRCSNNVADAYSADLIVKVVKIPSKTTAYRSASAILYGGTFRLYGAVTPPAPGAVVVIQAKRGTGAWYNLTSTTLSSASTYSRYIRPNARGTWYFRVRYAGTATIAASLSPAVSVIVR